jgi:hypothetical protein
VLDVLVAGAVEGLPLASPPASPVVGTCYIVAGSPTGAWVGHTQHIAAYSSGGWRFLAPREGMRLDIVTSGKSAVYRSGVWEVGTINGTQLMVDGLKVVGARGLAIAAPAGGTTVDTEGRAAIGLILARLRQHGLIET